MNTTHNYLIIFNNMEVTTDSLKIILKSFSTIWRENKEINL
jgi:hypothetical protein